MSELETAQEMAETAVKQVNVFPLQGDKVDFLLNQLNQIASLPQLTISKSIAEMLDSINASEYENLIENFFEYYNDSTLSKRLYEFCMYPFNLNLCILYLVSIELGVYLVTVVER